MSSIFTYDLRTQNAVNFRELISRQISNNRVYFTFGKETAWANDASPDTPNTAGSTFINVWKNMIGAKLLTGNEVKHVIPRNNWTANAKYAVYNDVYHEQTLGNTRNFYIVTSDWNVYKCLDNGANANSTIMPTQTYTDKAIEETDGYVWKFMYSIPSEDRLRFTTDAYIPVKYLTESDGSLQWLVQANATVGGIESVIITNSGNNYTNANTITVTISGDGTGAVGLARVNTSSNTIKSIVMTTKGSGYTYANIAISDTGTGQNAAARMVLSPPGGHGSNPLLELGGSYLILNPRLKGTENGKFPVKNEFRQIAFIANPKERGGTTLASNVSYAQFIKVTLDSSITNYLQDEIVYQGPSLSAPTFTGIVEEWDSGNNILILTNITGTIESDVLIGANSGAAIYVQSYTDKELKDYSGNLLYINNMTPISRASDQIEDFKIVLGF